MVNKYSFYLQKNNQLFDGNVLSVCYKADNEEVIKYGLTGNNILVFIKVAEIDDLVDR